MLRSVNTYNTVCDGDYSSEILMLLGNKLKENNIFHWKKLTSGVFYLLLWDPKQ